MKSFALKALISVALFMGALASMLAYFDCLVP